MKTVLAGTIQPAHCGEEQSNSVSLQRTNNNLQHQNNSTVSIDFSRLGNSSQSSVSSSKRTVNSANKPYPKEVLPVNMTGFFGGDSNQLSAITHDSGVLSLVELTRAKAEESRGPKPLICSRCKASWVHLVPHSGVQSKWKPKFCLGCFSTIMRSSKSNSSGSVKSDITSETSDSTAGPASGVGCKASRTSQPKVLASLPMPPLPVGGGVARVPQKVQVSNTAAIRSVDDNSGSGVTLASQTAHVTNTTPRILVDHNPIDSPEMSLALVNTVRPELPPTLHNEDGTDLVWVHDKCAPTTTMVRLFTKEPRGWGNKPTFATWWNSTFQAIVQCWEVATLQDPPPLDYSLGGFGEQNSTVRAVDQYIPNAALALGYTNCRSAEIYVDVHQYLVSRFYSTKRITEDTYSNMRHEAFEYLVQNWGSKSLKHLLNEVTLNDTVLHTIVALQLSRNRGARTVHFSAPGMPTSSWK